LQEADYNALGLLGEIDNFNLPLTNLMVTDIKKADSVGLVLTRQVAL